MNSAWEFSNGHEAGRSRVAAWEFSNGRKAGQTHMTAWAGGLVMVINGTNASVSLGV
jgi:hypothetical protein